jgi:phosphoglycerate dehydrogenase-like enzyme
MRVIGWSPHLTRERAAEAGIELAGSKEEIFKQSDIISIHMLLSESTQRMITAADFGLMKPTAFFINTSRGPLVDEAALTDVLRQRKIAGAGLDVYDIEPLPLDHPLRKLDNVTLSPHMGYVSDTNYEVSQNLSIYIYMVAALKRTIGLLGGNCRKYRRFPGRNPKGSYSVNLRGTRTWNERVDVVAELENIVA